MNYNTEKNNKVYIFFQKIPKASRRSTLDSLGQAL